MPERPVILDTGPLVAALVENEPRHAWAAQQFKLLPAPFLTCEAVLTEAFHLLSRTRHGPRQFFQLLGRGLIHIDFALLDEVDSVQRLIDKYKDLPMSLADACLVRMTEQHTNAIVLTLDRHFAVYRKHGRQTIATVMPD